MRVAVGAWFLSAVLCFPSPAFAQLSLDRERTEEEWTVLRDDTLTWEEMPALVHEYNPTIVRAWLDFYEQEDEGVYNISYDEALSSIEENYEDALNGASDAEAAVAAYQYLSNRTRSRLDSAVQTSDRQVVRLSLDQQEAAMAAQLRQMLIRVRTNALSTESSRLTSDYQKDQYAYQTRLRAAGVATDTAVLEAKERMENAALSVTNAETQEKQNRQSLIVNLGWACDAPVVFGEIPPVPEEVLDGISLDADLAAALSENYTLSINRRKLAVTETDSGRASLEETIRNNEESVKSDVTSKYRTLLQSRDSLAQQALNLENLRNSLLQAQNGKAAGTVSARQLAEAEYRLKSGEYQYRQAEYSVLAAYYNYEDAVHGLASAG